MANSPKKQSFLHGTALLTMAAAIVKVIGAIYSIPLKAIIDYKGFGYYSTAYEIYTVLLTISVTGLPVAMSRLVSQASSLGHYGQVRRIFKTSRCIFLTLGALGSLCMMLLCKFLAEKVMLQPDAAAAIFALGPSSFLICMMSTYRGFFQGQGNMLPTSLSQIMEAVIKLTVGISLSVLAIKLTSDVSIAAAGAILGVTVSCLASAIFLYTRFRKAFTELPQTGEPLDSHRSTAKRLLAIAVPITIGSAGLSILNAMEIGIYMGRLLEYLPQELADTQKGIYNFTQKLFNLPTAFTAPISVSIIPAITSHLTLKNNRGVRATAESAARVMGLLCMPCAIGLAVLAEPITALLGNCAGDDLTLATRLLTVLGVSIIFNATMLLTNAIMQAHGHANLPVINMFIGAALKLVAVLVLTSNPHIGILGVPIGTLLFCATTCILNLVTMRKVVPSHPAIFTNMAKPLLAALLMGLLTWLSWYGLKAGLHITSRLVLCAAPICVGVAVYAVAAVKLKAITREDCLLLPKGDKIAKLLHL